MDNTATDVPTTTRPKAAAARAQGPAGHIPALDGVRGLAILMVMFTHFTLVQQGIIIDRVWGMLGRFGWSGVDLFFVLSGFLITGILLDNKGQPHYFRNFYARRTLRIFPLYYVVILFATLVLPWLPIAAHENFRPIPPERVPLYWLYLSNFPIAFTADQNNDMIGITWSLAIEEQFYLIWPLVVLLCSVRTLRRICFTLVVAALAIRTWMVFNGFERLAIYVVTFCRMDTIAIGSLLALTARNAAVEDVPRILRRATIIAAACTVVLLGVLGWHRTTSFTGGPGQTIGYSAIAILFGCLLLMALYSAPRSIAGRVFGHPWLMFLGRYSYGLYLFHMPIHRLVRIYIYDRDDFYTLFGSRLPGQLLFYVLCLIPTVILALLSWHLLEKRCLALKRYFPTQKRPTTATAWEGADLAKPQR